MTYQELQEIIKEITNNKILPKEGFIMVYTLDEVKHRKLDEFLFFKYNPTAKKSEFTPKDVFEVELNGFKIMFITKNIKKIEL